MKEFINKLIESIKAIPVQNRCSECPHKAKCDDIENNIDECVDLCGATIKEVAIDKVKMITKEYEDFDICYSGIPCEYQNKDAKLPLKEAADTDGWISCKLLIPEEGEIHEVTVEAANDGKTTTWRDFAFYDISKKVWKSITTKGAVKVIAWRPYAEPYKGE